MISLINGSNSVCVQLEKKSYIKNECKRIGEILREFCRYKGVEILEGHTMIDYIHLCMSIPTKYSVSMFIGYQKGKSVIKIFKDFYYGRKQGFMNLHFWSRGYCVNKVCLDKKMINKYIRNQEKLDQDL